MKGKFDTFVEGFHIKDEVLKMDYEQLGNTNLMLSKLGLGGAAMSGFYDEFEDGEAIETINQAVKCGINYIDTAPFYGEGRSETLIGKALSKIPRNAYYISTKVGRYTKDWKTSFDYSEQTIISKFNESLERLGIDYVDIVILHDVEFLGVEKSLTQGLPAVKKIIDSGKAKYIAISGYPLSDLEKILAASTIKIDCVLTYSRDTLIDQSLHEYIPRFKEMGLGIINAAPTALSLLTSKGPQPWHPASDEIKRICDKAVKHCKENDIEIARLALHHTLQTKGCHNVLVGMNSQAQLNDNLSVLYNGLSKKELKELKYLKKNILPQENLHWEGVEIAAYKKAVDSTDQP